MKCYINFQYPFLLVLFIFFSCEKEISFDLDTPEDILCLNCILEAGNDSVAIYVTKIQSVENDTAFTPVANARIVLTKGGQLLQGIVYRGKGRYLLKHKPEVGKKYEIRVEVDGYKTLNAETRVPVSPDAQAKYLPDTIYDDYWATGYYTVPKIVVDLKDTPEKDYYWFKMGVIIYPEGNVWGSYTSIFKTDNLLFDEFNRYYDQDYQPPFTNYEYIGSLRMDDEIMLNNELQFSLSGIPPLTLFIINGDIHFDKYYKSSIKQFLTYEYDNLPVFEPVQVYSNITNGFGIFSSIAISKFTFKAKK
jgi:hypothetical protein